MHFACRCCKGKDGVAGKLSLDLWLDKESVEGADDGLWLFGGCLLVVDGKGRCAEDTPSLFPGLSPGRRVSGEHPMDGAVRPARDSARGRGKPLVGLSISEQVAHRKVVWQPRRSSSSSILLVPTPPWRDQVAGGKVVWKTAPTLGTATSSSSVESSVESTTPSLLGGRREASRVWMWGGCKHGAEEGRAWRGCGSCQLLLEHEGREGGGAGACVALHACVAGRECGAGAGAGGRGGGGSRRGGRERVRDGGGCRGWRGGDGDGNRNRG